MTTHRLGNIKIIGVWSAALLAGVAACGTDFDSGDCKATRTCAPEDESGGSTGEAGANAAGAAEELGGTAAQTDGHAGEAATAGTGAQSGCSSAADCSNGDPADGEESCDPSGACVAGNPPPKVVSVTPAEDAEDVALDTKVVVEFDEALDPTSVNAQSVQLLLSDRAVAGIVTYEGTSITFTPTQPLALLGDYRITIGTTVTDTDGSPLPETFSSPFQSRDGVWSTIDAIESETAIRSMAPSLPLTADGTALLVWAGDKLGNACPVRGSKFVRGTITGSTTLDSASSGTVCREPVVAGNALGVRAAGWVEPDVEAGLRAQQYRNGAWLENSENISNVEFQHTFGIAVGPDGVSSILSWKQGAGSKAWRTDAVGVWKTTPTTLDALQPTSQASIGFDSKGNGLAVWRAFDPANSYKPTIMAARYAVAAGTWTASVPMLGNETDPGAPAVAVDDKGDGLAIWVRDKQLVSSRYTQGEGWGEAETLSGALSVEILEDAPALVFDGAHFVAAWTATDKGAPMTYTASYELKTGWAPYEMQQKSAADGKSAARMPRLGSDGRGNLHLVWAKGAKPTFTLVSQRFSHGTWSPIAAVPGGTVSGALFESDTRLPLSVNFSGLAAMAWPNTNASGDITGVRLASFY